MDIIIEQFKLVCKNHNNCSFVATMIDDFIRTTDDGEMLAKLLKTYIAYLNSGPSYTCITKGQIYANVILQLLQKIFPHVHHKEDLFYSLVKGGDDVLPIFKYLVEIEKMVFSSDFLERSLVNKNIKLTKYMVQHITPTKKCMDLILSDIKKIPRYRYYYYDRQENNNISIDDVNDIFGILCGSKYKFSDDIMSFVIENTVDHKTEPCVLLDTLLKYNIQPNNNDVINICKTRNVCYIKRFVQGQTITSEMVGAVCKGSNNDYCRYSKGENKDYSLVVAEIMDLFVSQGFVLTKQNVIELLKQGFYVNDVHKYVKQFDAEIIDACIIRSYYPYKNCMESLKCLEYECKKSGNIIMIKNIIVTGKIKPSIICLQNACSIKGNLPTIKYLIEKQNLIPDKTCLDNIKKVVRNSSLDLIMKSFDFVPKNVANNVVVDVANNVVVDDADSDDTSEEQHVEEKEDDNEDQNNIKPIVVIKKVLKTEKGKLKVVPNMVTLFACKKEMTFIEARKKVVEYIKKNNLLDKNLIKLNKELALLLQSQENQYVDFSQINEIVSHIFIN